MNEETIFAEALALPVSERPAYLDAVCVGQPELRQRIESLLQAHDAGSLLNPPVADPNPTGDAATAEYHPAIEPGVVIAGRYTLVQKIGEGGMGEVWLAKQTEPVKRKVALKLIKAGLDSRAVVARFENERQALAMMDHPNIARVLDGGLTPTGQPFFVMELVNGLALSKFCDQARLSLRERLELFVPICQAVQHAHYKGVVHRDLKPANILVTLIDARPVPKVIDFGVAKATGGKLTDESLATQFGAIVGTLEYLSPEQAGYSGLDIDTRADIYSLGVILYELLTGLRPIDAKRLKKAAFTEMIRMIHEEEPSKPSTRLSTDEALPSLAALRQTEPRKLMALLRGELDWVVMKCLEKQRERRYTTANSLAAEIQRYLADEAVEARPPSAAYRMSKFLKRHKGPVLAASLLLLALVGGIAGTTWGLIRADRARAAEAERGIERDAALGNLEKANTKLTTSEDELLSSVARSLLRPLAVQVRPNQPLPPLNDQEIEALWDLASSKDERLRLRFVELALQDPVSTRRLKERASFALQATVGLKGTLRTQVEELLGKRLQAKETPQEHQVDVALCLANLGYLNPPLAARAAATITLAMSKTTDLNALEELSQGLSAVANRLEPKEAAQACGQAILILNQAMKKTVRSQDLALLARSISAVACRRESSEVALTLIQATSVTSDNFALDELTKCLSIVANHLGPKDAADAAVLLTQAMDKDSKWNSREYYLSNCLWKVTTRLGPKEASNAATAFTQAMGKTTNPDTLEHLANGLSAVASRMEPKEAARVCDQVSASLIQAMSKTTKPEALGPLSRGLWAVANRLEPKEVDKTMATITQVLCKTTNPDSLETISLCLSARSSQMEPKELARLCGLVAISLIHAMEKTTEPNALFSLSYSLQAIASWMEKKEATMMCGQAVAILSEAMLKTKEPMDLGYMAGSLSMVTPWLEPKKASRACGQVAIILIQEMSKPTEPNSLNGCPVGWTALHGLSAVAVSLESKEAAEVTSILTQAMSKTTNLDTLANLAKGLSDVASRLEPKEAAEALGQASVTLNQAMRKTTDLETLCNHARDLADGLSKVASRMERKEASRACGQAVAAITTAMSKTTDPTTLGNLAMGLSSVASQLEQEEAAHACGLAILTLTQAMKNTADLRDLRHLAGSLSAVARCWEPSEAAVTLIQAICETSEPGVLGELALGLSRVAAHLEPKEAADAAVFLPQAMCRVTELDISRNLSRALSAVLSRGPCNTLHERYTSATATVATLGGLGLPFTPLAWAERTLEPLTPPLLPQTLVDILKQPFCVGEARRLVLEQLGRHYHRPFADQWEFVDYVHQHKLALDLTTPPQRPAGW